MFPFVFSSSKHQNLLTTSTSTEILAQGYFQLLFSCIERLLAFLNVRSFVLPAAEEAESLWIKKFGFGKIPSEQVHVLFWFLFSG